LTWSAEETLKFGGERERERFAKGTRTAGRNAERKKKRFVNRKNNQALWREASRKVQVASLLIICLSYLEVKADDVPAGASRAALTRCKAPNRVYPLISTASI
jgi:hypothetical protein